MEKHKEYKIELVPPQHLLPGVKKVSYVLHENVLQIIARETVLATYTGDRAKEVYEQAIQSAFGIGAYKNDVKQMIEYATGYKFDELEKMTRLREIIDYRHITMWWLYFNTKWTVKYIGQFCGGFDHTTVLHAKNKVENLLECDHEFMGKVKNFMDRVTDYKNKSNEIAAIKTEAQTTDDNI